LVTNNIGSLGASNTICVIVLMALFGNLPVQPRLRSVDATSVTWPVADLTKARNTAGTCELPYPTSVFHAEAW
jgi:hypothetical protein